jgi:hypothetical protein
VGIAEDAGVDTADFDACPALIVAVGPVPRAALEGDVLRVDVEPQTPRMGAMYQALAAALPVGPSPASG